VHMCYIFIYTNVAAEGAEILLDIGED